MREHKEIIESGFADWFELNRIGIMKTVELGKNEFGFRERRIHTYDGSEWEYIPEDNQYELVRQG